MLKLFVILMFALTAFGADPLVGTWKFNLAKSKGTTELNNLRMTSSMPAKETYVFKMDPAGDRKARDLTIRLGTEGPSEEVGIPGGKIQYKRIDERSYETITTVNGKVVRRGKVAVSPDGRELTITVTRAQPDGKQEEFVAVYDRQ
jgi:hypothetical protein